MIEPRSISAAVITAVIIKVAEIVILPYCSNLSRAMTYEKQPEKQEYVTSPVQIPPVFVGSSQPSTITAGWASKIADASQSIKSLRSWWVLGQCLFVWKERDKRVLFFYTVFLFLPTSG